MMATAVDTFPYFSFAVFGNMGLLPTVRTGYVAPARRHPMPKLLALEASKRLRNVGLNGKVEISSLD